MKKSELRQIIREIIISEVNSKITDYAKKQAPGMGFVPLSNELQDKFKISKDEADKIAKEAIKNSGEKYNRRMQMGKNIWNKIKKI